jgi:hypothetical protein
MIFGRATATANMLNAMVTWPSKMVRARAQREEVIADDVTRGDVVRMEIYCTQQG